MSTAGAVVGLAPDYVLQWWPTARVDVLEVVTDESYTPRPYRVLVTGPAQVVARILEHALLGGVYADRVRVDMPSLWAPAENGAAGYARRRVPADLLTAAGIRPELVAA